jgi:hypothetical protein
VSFTSDSTKTEVVLKGEDHDHRILCALFTLIVLETELGMSLIVLCKVG